MGSGVKGWRSRLRRLVAGSLVAGSATAARPSTGRHRRWVILSGPDNSEASAGKSVPQDHHHHVADLRRGSTGSGLILPTIFGVILR